VTVRITPGRRIDGIAFSRAVNGGPDGNECCLLGAGYEEESFEPAAPAIYRWSVLAFLFLKDRLRDSKRRTTYMTTNTGNRQFIDSVLRDIIQPGTNWLMAENLVFG
jgi:hypothetical protein